VAHKRRHVFINPNGMRRDDNAPLISAATTNRLRYTKRCAVVVVEGATLALV
jgi:hypothetical protein